LSSTATLVFRPATPADEPFLLRLRGLTMDEHLRRAGSVEDDERRIERIRADFDWAQVIECEGEPVGFLKVRRDPGEWRIVQVQLMPALQGRGTGGAIVAQVLKDAAAAGASVTLSVLKGNPAKRLYERLGFVATGEGEHGWEMRWEIPR
jgi:ribosomal protein S18 acetylase RimI-like enzyme